MDSEPSDDEDSRSTISPWLDSKIIDATKPLQHVIVTNLRAKRTIRLPVGCRTDRSSNPSRKRAKAPELRVNMLSGEAG